MRVASNTLSTSLLNEVGKLSSQNSKLQQQLATGQKITRASDDAIEFRQIKELQSKERSMLSYRSNLQRANLITNLTESNLEFIKGLAEDAISSSDIIDATINDKSLMGSNANLIAAILQQVLESLNAKNGDESLFGGSHLRSTPYTAVTDATTGVISFADLKTTNGVDPTLVSGQTYEIVDNGSTADFSEVGGSKAPETSSTFTTPADLTGLSVTFGGATLTDTANNTVTDASGLAASTTYTVTSNGSTADFTSSGAADNKKGTVFTFNGTAPTFGTAALKMVAAEITSTEVSDLVVGRAYEISALGTGDSFTDSGASTNTVGHQFIYNGTAPTWSSTDTKLIPLQVDDSTKVTASSSLTSNDLYKIAKSSPLGSELPNLVEGDTVTTGKIYKVVAVNASDNSLSSYGGPSAAEVGDIFHATATTAITHDDLELKAMYLPTDNVTNGTVVSNGTTLSAGDLYKVKTAAAAGTDFSAVTATASGTFASSNATSGAAGDLFTVTTAASFSDTSATIQKLTQDNTDISAGGALVVGKTYIVKTAGDISAGNATFTGTTAAGTMFTATSTGPIAATSTAVINEVYAGKVDKGESYLITTAGDFSRVGGPSTGQVGQIFTATSTDSFSDGSVQKLINGITDVDEIDEGESFVIAGTSPDTITASEEVTSGDVFIVTTAGNFANRGGSATGAVGDLFTATSTGTLDSVDGNGAVQKLTEIPLEIEAGSTLTNGTVYKVTKAGGDYSAVGGPAAGASQIGDLFTADTTTNTTFTSGEVVELTVNGVNTISINNSDSLVVGKTYIIGDNGNKSEFTNSGATENTVGATFTYNGTAPTFGGDGYVVQVDAATGVAIDGTAINDAADMTAGNTYQIIDNGSSADFIASGAANNKVGTQFIYNGTLPAFTSGAILEPVDTPGVQVTDPNDLVSGTQYRIQYNGFNADFTDSGAADNNLGTIFTYNGNLPDNMGTAYLIEKIEATDFTSSNTGSSINNNEGTSFTANSTAPTMGVNGKVFQYMAERTIASDFTLSGSAANTTGTTFTYNGTEPTFGDANGDGAVLWGYTRERIAASYQGSGSNREFFVAEDEKLAINNDVQHNAKFDDFVNALALLYEGYNTANTAAEDDIVTRDAAKEKIKEAANRLDKADDDILLALSDLGITQMKLTVAEEKDNKLFHKREDLIGRKSLINETEVITKLNQSINAYQAALQSGARTMTLSLMDFI